MKNMLGLLGVSLVLSNPLTVSGAAGSGGRNSRVNRCTPHFGEKQRRKVRERAAKAALKAAAK